ncbi:unnamed protein product [Polarella glacialis]|nr:unnamed protein product [Polarella glacialis]
MTCWEMSPYVRAAEAAGYEVQFVEPWELHPEWNKLPFLHERNAGRAAMGKSIDDATLQRMVQRFEPLPAEGALQLVRASEAPERLTSAKPNNTKNKNNNKNNPITAAQLRRKFKGKK